MINEKGISLVETLIVATLMLVVLSTAFLLIVHFGDAQRTQLAQTRLSEESRFMFNAFADELKDAGAILTLAHSNTFLNNTPYFNGLFPLDNTNGPDGIIIASGDPNGATTLTVTYKPSSGGAITVKSTLKKDGTSAWADGDKGILIAHDGYYVFSVEGAPTATTLPLRAEAVYYSGLLNNCGTYLYSDTLQSPATVNGDSIDYAGSTSTPFTPVMRLTNFTIYLFNKVYDGRLHRDISRLYGITDTLGEGGTALLTNSNAIVSDNVCDMQLSYTFFTDFPNDTPTYTALDNSAYTPPPSPETVYSMIQRKFLKEINASIVVLTDEYGGTGTRTLKIPAIKNRSGYSLPAGKYSFKIYSYIIQNKNFNIVI